MKHKVALEPLESTKTPEDCLVMSQYCPVIIMPSVLSNLTKPNHNTPCFLSLFCRANEIAVELFENCVTKDRVALTLIILRFRSAERGEGLQCTSSLAEGENF